MQIRLPVAALFLLAIAGCGWLLGADFDRPGPAAGGDSGACGDDDCHGSCGQIISPCGNLIACGGCAAGLTCGGGGTANQCGVGSCSATCSGKACGASNGCDGVCTQGSCSAPGDYCEQGVCTCESGSCGSGCMGTTCEGGSSPDAPAVGDTGANPCVLGTSVVDNCTLQ